MPLSEKPHSPVDESEAAKKADRKLESEKKKYEPPVVEKKKEVIKEVIENPPYTIEETFRNITVNFGDDFRLSMDNGTERDENGEITSDGTPCIIHSDEWFMYPEDIQHMDLPDSPYPPSGNDLADAFLKALNFYMTSYYNKEVKLSDDEVSNIVGKADSWKY